MLMSCPKTLFFLLWLFTSTNGLPYPWKETVSEMRLYMPDQQNKVTWTSEELSNGVELFRSPWFDRRKPSLVLAHGWFQSAEDEIIVMLLESLFEVKFYRKMNIIVLHTPYFMDSIISNIAYYYPAKNIEKAGSIVGEVFNKAIEEGLIKAKDINMLGLSLGAHLSGYIGRAVKEKIHSIVGLDPAGPGFDSMLQSWTKFQHVSKSDAQFVHLYHTNSHSFGTTLRIGTADFEFNEGISQPGCATSIDPKCSHKRAFYVFNDIIRGDTELIALRCDSHRDFKKCLCRGKAEVILQYPVDTSAEGIYFLKTSSKAPFGLGEEGVTCWKDQWESLQRAKQDEKLKTVDALMQISENFRNNMAHLYNKETYLAKLKPKESSEEM